MAMAIHLMVEMQDIEIDGPKDDQQPVQAGGDEQSRVWRHSARH
jgi:hypothetical protein